MTALPCPTPQSSPLLAALGAYQSKFPQDFPFLTSTRIAQLVDETLGKDQLTAISAVYALGSVPTAETRKHLTSLLSEQGTFLRAHVASALVGKPLWPEAIQPLIDLVREGDFGGMHAQRTLESWGSQDPRLVACEIISAIDRGLPSEEKYRLVETLGLIPHEVAGAHLQRIVLDAQEDEHVRVAAISALPEHLPESRIRGAIVGLSGDPGVLGDAAQIALMDSKPLTKESRDDASKRRGLRVAQLFLHADIDAELAQAGSGDTGGIATLLVRLGDALVNSDSPYRELVDETMDVVTISRGTHRQVARRDVKGFYPEARRHEYAKIPLLEDSVPAAKSWSLWLQVRRGIRRILKSSGGVDVIHLRMADVGSFAAWEVAQELKIPVVFTTAPDPHTTIQSLELSGDLNRENFGSYDAANHFWFRTWLVKQLTMESHHAVFFPRPHLRESMKSLIGIDLDRFPKNYTVVPEGVDLEITDNAMRDVQDFVAKGTKNAAVEELLGLLEQLPAERLNLPLVISVGRFHRVKGMATIVESWATSDLRNQTNLLLVGGNLQNPSADELEQLDRINALIPLGSQRNSGLILSGHRPNNTVAHWMAAVQQGIPSYIRPKGVYVCGSLKEEFGIAILEAMATGLLVVAPNSGGPASYLKEGYTGFLTEPGDPKNLQVSMYKALLHAAEESTEHRATDSRHTVQEKFTINKMAERLRDIYQSVGQNSSAPSERKLVALG